MSTVRSSVVIFGATGAIGSALAKALHKSGRHAFLVGRNVDKLQPLAASLSFPHAQCDVMTPGDVERAMEEATTAGPVSGVAYCVGDIVLKPLKRTTSDDFLDSYRLNVLGAADAVKAAQKSLEKQGKESPSSVVFFSSVAASNGFTNHSVIGSSKAALEGLTVSLAAELKPKVRVNCIAPSLSISGMAAPMLASDATKEAIAKSHPMRRLGEGEDHAEMAAFLLSDKAGWITGQVIAIDGGRGALPN